MHPKRNVIDLRREHRVVLTIDRSSFKLRYFKNLKLKRSYGVAVGAPGYETPTGRFSIHNKAVNPAWSAPDEPWAGAYRNEVVEGGSAENPLSCAQIEGKFRTYADGVLSPSAVAGTIDAVGDLERLGSVRKLMDMLRAAPRRGQAERATLAAARG